jgi:hypothetical protein
LAVSTASATTFVPPPSGSGVQCGSGEACSFPLQACTDPSQFYYSIHLITITDADGNGYELGSSAVSGMYWPTVLGGPVPGPDTLPLSDGVGNQGDALNVTIGDTFVLPFGAGAGGFTFTTSLGSPPQTHAPEGPFYWWTEAGNVNGAGLRLDQHPSINPTTTSGTYVATVEGVAVCGVGVFFDQGTQVPFRVNISFSTSPTITAPEFPLGMALLVALAVPTILLVKKKFVPSPMR